MAAQPDADALKFKFGMHTNFVATCRQPLHLTVRSNPREFRRLRVQENFHTFSFAADIYYSILSEAKSFEMKT
jgi:hypothetical protein